MTKKPTPEPGDGKDFYFMINHDAKLWAPYIMDKYGMTVEEYDRCIYRELYDYDGDY